MLGLLPPYLSLGILSHSGHWREDVKERRVVETIGEVWNKYHWKESVRGPLLKERRGQKPNKGRGDGG